MLYNYCVCMFMLEFFLMAYVSGDSLMSRRMAATGREKRAKQTWQQFILFLFFLYTLIKHNMYGAG